MPPLSPHALHQPSNVGGSFDQCGISSTLSSRATSIAQQPPDKRPKLSLQTSSLPIAPGKSSTGLVITSTALDTSTPTILNTFANAYSFEIPHRSSPLNTASPATARPPSRTGSPLTTRRDAHSYVFNQPIGLKSILRNSPVPPSFRTNTNSASPRTGRRVFFPAIKRVAFKRDPDLVEFIRTSRSVLSHEKISPCAEGDGAVKREPDMAGGDDSDTANEDQATSDPGEDDSDESSSTSSSPPQLHSKKRKSINTRSSRQIAAAALRDQLPESFKSSASRNQACSPVSSESKRRGSITSGTKRRKYRKWEWTLAPLDEVDRMVKASSTGDRPDARQPSCNTPPLLERCDGHNGVIHVSCEAVTVSQEITEVIISPPLPYLVQQVPPNLSHVDVWEPLLHQEDAPEQQKHPLLLTTISLSHNNDNPSQDNDPNQPALPLGGAVTPVLLTPRRIRLPDSP